MQQSYGRQEMMKCHGYETGLLLFQDEEGKGNPHTTKKGYDYTTQEAHEWRLHRGKVAEIDMAGWIDAETRSKR